MKYLTAIYDFFRYSLYYYICNMITFSSEMWQFRAYDYRFNLSLLRKSLIKTRKNINNGVEYEISRDKKLKQIDRIVELLTHFIDDDFITQAETILGYEMVCKFEFVKCEDNPNLLKMIDNCTELENNQNDKILALTNELNESQWDEIWTILKGKGECPEVFTFEKWDNGTDMRGWWT